MEIAKITISYQRHTRIEREIPLPEADEPMIIDWFSTEKLVLDRKTETIKIIRKIAQECGVSIKYHVGDGVSDFLDNLDADSIFAVKPTEIVEIETDPQTCLTYKIVVVFDDGNKRTISGKYNYNELPTDYAEFIESLIEFMDFYGYFGEMFSHTLYENPKQKGDYIFCSVEFGGYSESYYYLAEDDIYEVGDTVIVPVGNKQKETKAEIVDIEYFDEDTVPIPLDKVKKIIRKA